jgi:hypothetical protein
MEERATYKTAAAQPAVIACPSCSAQLGEVVEISGRAWLRVGSLELYAAHGRCACGIEWHWTSSEQLLKK